MKNEIENLVYLFSKLPGLGPRSARRIILHLLKDKELRMVNLINAMSSALSSIKECSICYNIDTVNPCAICTSSSRTSEIIAIVENVSDLWAMERSGIFKGTYHVLGGTLSASSNITPESLKLSKLKARILQNTTREVIIATNATLDGQTTAFYINDYLKECNTTITRLASGIPIGGELDYLDEGTLSAALASRRELT